MPPALESRILLAIETAGSLCSVAVGRGGDLLASEARSQRHGHAEALLPMIDRVTADAGLRPQAIDIVAVTVGPGGFTGIRVGLAAAHGIALAAKARLIGVTTFDAVAAAIPQDARASAEVLLVAIDSRRTELYVQLFGLADGASLAPPAAITAESLAAFVDEHVSGRPVLLAGDAAALAAQSLPRAAVSGVAADARGVVLAAWQRMRSGAASEPARPLYIRPPDVTLPRQPFR
jgi:tRNA threonylcarbamoyladenosine biosynthesis protein TsaB